MKSRPDTMIAVAKVLLAAKAIQVEGEERVLMGLPISPTKTNPDQQAEDNSDNKSDTGSVMTSNSQIGIRDLQHSSSKGHRNYNCFRVSPIPDLMVSLTRAEPVAFSLANLLSLKTKDKRTVDKEILGELMEFISGIDLDYTFDPNARDANSKATIVAQLSKDGGRRGRDLTLPDIDWETDGIFSVTRGSHSSLVLGNRFSKKDVMIPKILLKGEKNGEALGVSKNFSETKVITHCATKT